MKKPLVEEERFGKICKILEAKTLGGGKQGNKHFFKATGWLIARFERFCTGSRMQAKNLASDLRFQVAFLGMLSE